MKALRLADSTRAPVLRHEHRNMVTVYYKFQGLFKSVWLLDAHSDLKLVPKCS